MANGNGQLISIGQLDRQTIMKHVNMGCRRTIMKLALESVIWRCSERGVGVGVMGGRWVV